MMNGNRGFPLAMALALGTSTIAHAAQATPAPTTPPAATPADQSSTGQPPADQPPPDQHRRPTETQAPTSDSSAQSQLTQDRRAKGSRFKASTRPVPTFPNPYPEAAQGLGVKGGRYYVSRWAEDWSFYRNTPRSEKTDLFDPLKYIPLSSDGQIWISFSGEERFRANITGNPGLKDARMQDQELFRNILGADLHLGDHVRLFGEINSSEVTGANTGAVSTQQRNSGILEQAFAEVSGDVFDTHVMVRAGTQEFMDGPPNIIHIRPAPDVYTTVNGVRGELSWKFARIDLFDFRALTLNQGWFDDPVNSNQSFWGFNASFKTVASTQATLFLDPYWFRYHNASVKYGNTLGDEHRDFFGARLWGTLADGTLDMTLVRQTGSFAARPISAWGVFTNFGYLLGNSAFHPRLGLHIDYASGGGTYSQNGPLKDFNFFYGSIPYFTWGNLYGPTNIAEIAPSFRFTPLNKVTFTTELQFIYRPDQNDAFYTFTGAAYAGTQNVPGHTIGKLWRADVAFLVGEHINIALKVEHLFAGSVLTRAGYTGTTFFGPELYFRW